MTPIDPRLLRRAAPVRWSIAASVLIGTATAGLIVAQAWLLARSISSVVGSVAGADPGSAGELLRLLPWLAMVLAARAVLGWLSSVTAHRSSAAVKSQLRNEIVAARLARPGAGGTPEEVDAAAVIMTVTTGLDGLDGYVARYLPQLVLAVVVPAVVVASIGAVDALSAVIVVLTLPLVPVFMVLIGRLTQDTARRRWRTQARLAHHFADLMAGLPTLQVLGRATAQATGLDRSGAAHRRATVATLRIAFLSSLVLELVAMLSVSLVAVGVGLRTVEGDLGLGIALFVLLLAPEAYRPLREVGVHYHDAADGLAAVDQAFMIIDAGAPDAPRRRPTDAVPAPPTAAVALHGVAVRYPGTETDALAPTDLTWAPGEVLALTGPSGSGKSTLLAALLGLVPLRAGTITVGGVDLTGVDPAGWRRRFAVVPQRPQLITATLADNVRLGTTATDAEVARALEAAGAGDLDPGRRLAGDAAELSAGEVRRVALARALLRVGTGRAQALVLDEPTAGLDAAAELAEIATLRALRVAILVVTHRPAVVAAADRVVELAVAAVGGRAVPEPVGVGA